MATSAVPVEENDVGYDSFNVGYLVVLGSSLLFYFNNYRLMRYYTPEIVRSSAKREWKWRNITNSLIHSFFTGVGACLCFYYTPEMRKDLVGPINLSSHYLISFSIGYFIYDLLDMAINDRKSKTYELLLHHFMVILCFGTAMTQKTYQGYSLMALLVEVNSIFLHVRQLMILTDFSKMSIAYRINNSLNMGTFVVFRILTLGWMIRWLIHQRNDTSSFIFYLSGTCTFWVFRILTLGFMSRWLIQHRAELNPLVVYLGAVSLTAITGMNTLLLYRILKSDYWQVPVAVRPGSPTPRSGSPTPRSGSPTLDSSSSQTDLKKAV